MKNFKIEYDPEKSDVFSLGIVVLSMCCLNQVDGRSEENINFNKINIKGKYPRINILLDQMLNQDPRLRKSFSDLMLLINNWGKEID